ncbi:MAG: hypothetical protein AB1758_32655, partial [Candidatus Eremiobacterota bacterium]
GTVVTSSWLPTGVQLDANKHKLTFTESIYVESSGTPPTDELNVVPRLGAPDAPPGDPEAAGDDAAIAAAIAGDPFMLASFMSSTQGSTADIDISDMSGNRITDVDWDSTNGFNDPVDPPVTYAMMIQMMANPTSVPGYQFNYADESINFVAVDLQQIAATAPWYTGPAGGDDGKIPVPSVADSLSAADLVIEFSPPDGEQAVLTAEGSLRLTSALKGKNGSITSGGDLRVTGLGAQFSASEESGVSMYARGDIVLSTLDEKTPGNFEYRDVKMKGVVYAQGDFVAKLGSVTMPGEWGSLDLEGCLIAYGGDPSNTYPDGVTPRTPDAPGSNGKGTIDLRARQVKLKFNPVYVGSLSQALPANFQLKSLSWDNRL